MTSLGSSSWVVPPAHGDGLKRIGAVDDAQHLAGTEGELEWFAWFFDQGDAVGGGDAPDGALRRAYHPGLPLNRAPSAPGFPERAELSQ
jgi:hypothetical protein